MIESTLTAKIHPSTTKNSVNDPKSMMSKTFYSPRAMPKNNLFEKDISLAQQKQNNKSGKQFQDISKTKKQFEDLNEKLQNSKDEFRRQFVDINFYGMQSKVKNPMSDINWRESFKKK